MLVSSGHAWWMFMQCLCAQTDAKVRQQCLPDAPLPLCGTVQHHKLQVRLLVQLVIVPQLHCNGLVCVQRWQVDVCGSAPVKAAQVLVHSQAFAAPHSGHCFHALHHTMPITVNAV